MTEQATQKRRGMSLPQEGRALRRKKAALDKAKKKSDELETAFKKAQSSFMERMAAEGVDGIKIDGRNLVPAQTEYSSINDLDAFVEWAEANDPALLKVAANKDELNKLVRQRLDDDEEMPPGVNFYVREYISDRAG